MNNLPFNGQQVLAIAESMSYTRERIQLGDPGIMLRSVRSFVTSILETVDRVFTTATREVTYCSYNPAECRVLA